MNEERRKFGANLRRVREAKGDTRAQLAEAIRSTEVAVASWENGTSSPRWAQLKKIFERYPDRLYILALGVKDPSRQRAKEFSEILARIRGRAAEDVEWIDTAMRR